MSALAAPANGQQRLVAALADPAVHRDSAARARLIETHISYVLLTGRHAYKIKKAVSLPFVDFSTLDARRRCCDEELRLNRRLAPDLYLDVVPITGTLDAPRLGGAGAPIEYAVRMREFPQDALLSRAIARGDVGAADADALASIVADFHSRIAISPGDGAYGSPARVLHYALGNFGALRELESGRMLRRDLDALESWTRDEFARRERAFDARRRDGHVRECHGDLHANNIARLDGALVPFDCLEFNAELRWIDTTSEIAFVAMDLDDRGRPDLARRFRNAYLERTGDYAGLAVYRFYYVYRALVRAKVAALREEQIAPGPAHDALDTELKGYVDLAARAAAPARPAIVVMHGYAGSGKSTLAQALVEAMDAVRLRSDVERKRMHGLAAEARSGSGVDRDLYADAATRAVYERIAGLARSVVDSGSIAIVDAASLKRWQRVLFRDVAHELGVACVVLSLSAPPSTLRERVGERSRLARDASEADVAVLEHQQGTAEPLADDETAVAIACDGATPFDRSRVDALARDIARRIGS